MGGRPGIAKGMLDDQKVELRRTVPEKSGILHAMGAATAS